MGTGVIDGVVTTVEDAPRPLRRARVTITGTGLRGSVQTITDDAGRFAFGGLPAGRYTLMADKPAYLPAYYGSRRIAEGPGTPIPIADGQRVANIRIGLLRGAALDGTVVDEHGKPLASAQVSALRAVMTGGDRKLSMPRGARFATTDDRGRYRLYGLPPGEYTVRAGVQNPAGGARASTPAALEAAARGGLPQAGPAVMRSGVYLPGVADAAQAEFVSLAAGAERTGVDLVVPLVRASRIDGLAITAGGQPLQNVLVGIANLSTGSMWTSVGGVRPSADGRFSLASMPPGRYLFFGRGTERAGTDASPGTNLPLHTSTEVLVGEGETVEAVLQFLPGVRVAGRVAPIGQAPMPDLSAFKLGLTALPGISGASVALAPATLGADGSFVSTGVPPGKYRLALSGSGPWVLRSAIFQGRDTLDLPLEVQPGRDVADMIVTLTDRPAEISGQLTDQLDRPAPEYAIVAFSTDRAHWTSAPRRVSGVVRVGSDGTFVVRGLPPGEYFLAALTDPDPAQLGDPSFLEYLATASQRITLAEGEKKVEDLKLAAR
jgi:protocatechuate 3,4-dioxygenase beta subunit